MAQPVRLLNVEVQMNHSPIWYRLTAHLALIRIHQLLLGRQGAASLLEVAPLGVSPRQFEALCRFERDENTLREQRGEPKFDLVLDNGDPLSV